MNKQPSRIGLYLVLIIALVAGYFYLNNQVFHRAVTHKSSWNRLLKTTRWLMQRFSRTEKFLPVQ